MFLTKFWFIWLSSFREEDFYKSTNQKQALLMAAMFILAKQFQRRRFVKIDQSETRIACGGHVC
jgi:hypothetical protein